MIPPSGSARSARKTVATRHASEQRNFPSPARRASTLPERIAWAAFFVALALAFTTSIDVQFTLPKLLWLRVLASVIVLIWALRCRRGDVRPIPAPILGAAGALLVWWIVTTVFAVDRATAMQGMHGRYNGLLNHAIFVSLFLALASTPLSRRDVEVLATSFVLALVPVAMYAVAQEAGLDPHVWPNSRPGSTIGHPVPLAASLSLAVPFLLAFLLTETHTLKRWTWTGLLVLFLLAIAATLSRGPWAGLSVAVAVMVVMAVRRGVVAPKKSWMRIAAVTLIAAAVALAWTSASLSRITTRLEALTHLKTDPSFMGRFVYFDAAGRMLRDHPLAGIGFESYALLYPRYRPVEGEFVPPDALPTMVHNGYLQMAVTNGLPAVVLYLTLMASIGLLVWRTCSRPRADGADTVTARDTMIGAAFLAAIAGYLVQDLSGWLEISLSAFFWTVLGAAVSFAAGASPAPRWPPAAGWRLAGSLAAVCVALAIASLAFGTLRDLRAGSHFFEAESRDISKDWPAIEGYLTAGLRLVPSEPHYEDVAGILYLKRLGVSGQREAYDRASSLLDSAATHDRFDPYILIHRIDLETAALQQKLVAGPSGSANRAVARLIDMDPNNATVHETIGRLRLAEGRPEAALASIRRAEELRPHHPRYHLIEGDALRSLGDMAAAIAPYRQETAVLAAGDSDWAVAEDKLILALSETGQYQTAADEARKVVARVPSDAVAYALLGFAYLRLNEVDLAKAAFSTALAADPTSPAARQGLLEVEQRDTSARRK